MRFIHALSYNSNNLLICGQSGCSVKLSTVNGLKRHIQKFHNNIQKCNSIPIDTMNDNGNINKYVNESQIESEYNYEQLIHSKLQHNNLNKSFNEFVGKLNAQNDISGTIKKIVNFTKSLFQNFTNTISEEILKSKP